MGQNNTTSIIAAGQVTQGIGSFASAYAQSQAIRAQGALRKQQLEFNAKVAEAQADDAIRRSKRDVERLKEESKKLIGRQRANLAAQGIEVNADTALDIQEETAEFAEIDAITIRNNAYREAFGFKIQALDLTGQARFTDISAGFQARSLLLGGALDFGSGFIRGATTFERDRQLRQSLGIRQAEEDRRGSATNLARRSVRRRR